MTPSAMTRDVAIAASFSLRLIRCSMSSVRGRAIRTTSVSPFVDRWRQVVAGRFKSAGGAEVTA